jgi:hypothetical protein
MTPNQKAEELINKFIFHTEKYNDGWIESDRNAAKVCALIVVDEIIITLAEDINPLVNYWFKVKLEIENL